MRTSCCSRRCAVLYSSGVIYVRDASGRMCWTLGCVRMGVGFWIELLKRGGCLRTDDSARDAPGLFVSASTDVRCSSALSGTVGVGD